MTTAKEHVEHLNKLVGEIDKAIEAAKKFADRHALEFSIEPAYGMGGTYHGKGNAYRDDSDLLDGWMPSSMSC